MHVIETASGRHKQLIGTKLRVSSLPGQQGRVVITSAEFNTMIRTAKLASVRVA